MILFFWGGGNYSTCTSFYLYKSKVIKKRTSSQCTLLVGDVAESDALPCEPNYECSCGVVAPARAPVFQDDPDHPHLRKASVCKFDKRSVAPVPLIALERQQVYNQCLAYCQPSE